MSDLKVSLTMQLVNRLTGPASTVVSTVKRLTDGVSSLGAAARKVSGPLAELGKSIGKKLADPNTAMQLNQAGQAVERFGNTLKNALATPIKTSEEFWQEMANVKANLNPTTEQFEILSKEAQRLGFELGEFTSLQAAQGMTLMAKAGRTTDDILKALPVTLNLSTAAGMDFAQTTNILLGALGAFHLKASDTARVADVLTATFVGSKVDLDQLDETLKYSAATAYEAGVSIEELALMAGVLGNASIDASVAGTTLNQMMMKLIAPTEDARKTLAGFGVKLVNTNAALGEVGALRSPIAIIKDLGDAVTKAGLNSVQTTALLEDLFDIRGFKGASQLMATIGGEEFNKLAGEIQNAKGRTDEIATAMRATAKNETLQLASAVESLQMMLGDMLAPALHVVKLALMDVVNAFAGWAKEYPNAAKGVMLVVAALAGLLAIMAPVLFGFASISAVVAFVMAPSFVAAAAAVWSALAPLLLFVAAAAGFAVVARLAYLLVFRFDDLHKLLVRFGQLLGGTAGEASVFASAVETAFDVVLGPILAVVRAVKLLSEHWATLKSLGGAALDVLAPGLSGAFGGNTVGAGIGGSSNIGGQLKITIDSEGKVTKTEAKSEGALDFAVDAGRLALGF